MNCFLFVLFIIIIILGFVLGFSYMLLMSIIVCILGLVIKKYHVIAMPLLIGLLLRLSMVILIHNNIIIEGDWDGYIERAILWSNNGLKSAVSHFTTGAYFYSWLASLVFSAFGNELTLFRILNAFISTLTILNVYLITKNLYCVKTGKIAAWLMALFPTAIFYSSFFCNREPLIIYFFTAALYYFLKWLDNMSLKNIILFFMIYAFTIILHSGFISALFILFIFMISKIIKSQKDYFSVFVHLVILIGLLAISLRILNSGNIDKFNFGGESLLQKLDWYSSASGYGRAKYLPNLSVNGFYDLLWQVPLKMLYFLLAPFPWMVANARDIYGILDASFYTIFVLLLIIFNKLVFSVKKSKMVFFIVLTLTILFSLATGNYGTAIRHRAKFVPVYISLISPSILYLVHKFRVSHYHVE